MKKQFLAIFFILIINFAYSQTSEDSLTDLEGNKYTLVWEIVPSAGHNLCNYNSEIFAEIDKHALSVPKSALSSVEELAAYLIEPAKTDLEKVRSIFIWITDNIAYDTNAYFSGRYGDLSAAGVLKSGKSICSGYSALFQSLCNSADLEVVTITGYAKGYSYRKGKTFSRANHAWNAVKLKNEWYLIDSTWASGSMYNNSFRKKFDEFWFLTPPKGFLFSHLPSDSQWQLIDEQIDMQQFLDSPNPDSLFFSLGFSLEDIFSYLESDNFRRFPLVYTTKEDVFIIECPVSMYLDSDKTYTISLKIDKAKSVAIVNNSSWRYFTKIDNIWSITISPKKGSFGINYSTKDRFSRHQGILKYVVE